MDPELDNPTPQPPQPLDPNTVTPEGTPTYAQPAAENQVGAVEDKIMNGQNNSVTPDQINNIAQSAMKAGAKAWVWWAAGIITTLVIVAGGVWYFYNVKGNTTPGNTNTAVTSKNGVELPDGFPKDFPLYPGQILSAEEMISVKGRFMASVLTSDSTEKVEKFYAKYQSDALVKNGWRTVVMTPPTIILDRFESGKATTNASVVYSTSGRKIRIDYSISPY